MPELPEVETVRRGLAERAVGRRVHKVMGEGGRLARHNPRGVEDLRAHLSGATITGAERRGKWLWLHLDHSNLSLVVHLGMSGQARISTSGGTPLAKHEHLRLIFEDGTHVSFVDPRTFGHLTISPLTHDRTGRLIPAAATALAPDPLEEVAASVWTEPMLRTRRAIKTALLDQNVISGIGNIYADEALFRARIPGRTPGRDLGEKRALGLIDVVRAVMLEALDAGGTSFDSLYVDVEGNPGYFSRSLQVYGREGEPCLECGGTIRREVLTGRSHFHCPTCQAALA